jgi:hypothetical protein
MDSECCHGEAGTDGRSQVAESEDQKSERQLTTMKYMQWAVISAHGLVTADSLVSMFKAWK